MPFCRRRRKTRMKHFKIPHFSKASGKPSTMMKRMVASTSGSVRPVTQCQEAWASPGNPTFVKIDLINKRSIDRFEMRRTNTTLYLSHNGKES